MGRVAMRRSLFALLLPMLIGATFNGSFRATGSFVASETAGGGAGTGVEARYATITAEPNFVIGCSEPMDTPNGETVNNTPYGSPDNTGSPDASECWGRGGDWQNATYQDPPNPPQGQTIVSVTGWGDVTHAAEQTAGRGDWWLGYKSSELAGDFSLTAATICYRYYKQVSSDYATASDSCSGTTRNKLAEASAGGDAFQLEEDVIPGGGCDTVSGSPRGIMACWDSGPGMEPDESCPWLSPTVRLTQAISTPLRIEECYETTDLATGANGEIKVYVTRLDTGVTSSYTSPSTTLGAPTDDDNWSANLDHTGGGTSWSGYFMFAVWDDVDGHTIGAACEIEGGC